MVRNLSDKNIPIYICKDGYGKEYTASNERFLAECDDFKVTDIEICISRLMLYYKTLIDEVELLELLYQK